jgi:hypothetical protein
VAAGVGVAIADGLLYLVFAAPSNTPSMTAWWRTSFIPVDQGMHTAAAVVAQRTVAELERGGFGPWPLVLLLVVAGTALLWRRGLRAAALMAPVVYAELLVAGSAGMYPFLDDRAGLRWTVRSSTSFSMLLTVMAVLSRPGRWWSRWWRCWYRRPPGRRARPSRRPPGTSCMRMPAARCATS